VDSVVSGSTVVDVSGNGINGTLTDGAAYSSTERALTFDGTDDYVLATLNNPSGAWVHSISFWFNLEAINAVFLYIDDTNPAGGSTGNTPHIVLDADGNLRYDFWGNAGYVQNNPIVSNTWTHFTGTYAGGATNPNLKIYLNGTPQSLSYNSGTSPLNAFANSYLILKPSQACSISNFKIWGGVALTAEEVAMEYALGRTGKSLNLTDTSLCLGGTAPRAQLDAPLAHFDRLNVGPSSSSTDSPKTHALLATSTHGSNHSSLDDAWRDIWHHDFDPNWNFKLSQYHEPGVLVKHAFRWKHGGGTSDNYMTFKGGNVGILTTNPDTPLTLKQSEQSASGGFQIQRSENTSSWQIYINANGTDLYFAYNGTTKGYLDRVNSAGLIDFTGQHRSFIDNVPYSKYIDLEGLIVSANKNKYFTIDESIQTGSNAIQISESLPLVSLSTKEKDKACFGVISGSEDPDSREYAQGSFVSVVQKQKGDRRAFINSVGEGAMWVTDINGPLESGDYITTSNVAGYGQRQDDDILHNYTVAKITMDCDFDPPDIPVQRILKELSNVNYWVKTTYSDVSLEEYSNLAEENRTTTTETVYTNEDDEITTDKYNTLESNVQSTYTELTRIIHQKMSTEEYKTEQEGTTLEVRQELVNVLDEHGQLQWEDDPSGTTEKAYKIRYLDTDGNITDEANAVHTAAFVGVTYHCG
jgi:hypothetical protein